MPKKKEKVEGKIWVERQYKKMGKAVDSDREEERLLVDTFDVEPARAEGSVGMTINMGNYESLRVDIGGSIPCYKEEIEKAHETLFQHLESELFDRVAEIEEVLDALRA